jgi:serine/threonine protein phosphatase PrpC
MFTPLISRNLHWATTRDTISNRDAVEIVTEVVAQACGNHSRWNATTGMQQAAEALTLEAYVRGSRDNIGVVVVALE